MKHISVLIPRGAIVGSMEGPRQVLSEVNEYLRGMNREPAFDVQLVALDKETFLNNGMFCVTANALMDEVTKTDLIVVPALGGNIQQSLEENAAFIPWIKDQYEKGAEVASLCLGAFLLAATGLLNGRKAATHWAAANDFRKMFPAVDLVEEKIITDENGIYSSGGAFSYLNLLLYLIEKYVGKDIAVLASKTFLIDVQRDSQSPFMIFRGQKDHEDEPIKKAQEFIEKNVSEKITVDQLASMLALGRRNLERRFKKATSNTVVEYMQRVKIEAAKMQLEMSRSNVNEVMYQVGYNDNKAFRTTFKRITGLSPIQYRNRYNRVN